MNFIKQKIQPRHIWTWSKANKNIVFFVSGFLFDVFTIKRIDAIGDLAIQIVYLMGLTGLLFYQYRAHRDRWTPGPWVSKVWEHNTEALHFMYGGLFSAYVILYFKSTSGVRAVFFIFLLVLLLVSNEMPQVKRMGFRLRLGLYAFCVTSFFIYFVPILMGRMNAWIFLLSIFISAVLVWFVAGLLVFNEPEKRKSQIRLYMPAACLFLTVLVLYFMKLIPPVPLSVQYQGIFHMVMRNENNFTLTYLKPPWYDFWTNDSTPFLYHPGDKLN